MNRIALDNTRFIFMTNFSGDPARDKWGDDRRKANIIIPSEDQAKDMTKAEKGTVIKAEEDELLVLSSNSILKINELQLEGKKRMSTADFLRGFKIERGTILGF